MSVANNKLSKNALNAEQKVAKYAYMLHLAYIVYAVVTLVFIITTAINFFFATTFLSDYLPAAANHTPGVMEKVTVLLSILNMIFFFYTFAIHPRIWKKAEYNTSSSKTFWMLFALTHLSTLFLFFSYTKIYLPGLSLFSNSGSQSILLSLYFMLPAIPLTVNLFGLIENTIINRDSIKPLSEINQ